MTAAEAPGKLSYESPRVVDYGSITMHTFTRAGGDPPKVGDWMTCKFDKYHEYSCTLS